MAKAINWPKEFYNEIINEDSANPKIALRLDSLYYDTEYYTEGEIVDIRVDHKIVRKGQIIGQLKASKISELDQNILHMYKNSLKSKESIINFLSSNYNKPVNEETVVTVITYLNLPNIKDEIVDDPHM